MKNPLLSIVMPSYNYARYLRQAIETILNQDFSDFEFIIIEDCSTDNSPNIIKEYAHKDGRIRPFFHTQNKGMVETINEGTAHAKGQYIHLLAADDFRYPGFLQKCMDVLLSNPELCMCCTQFHYGNDAQLLFETSGFESTGATHILNPKQMTELFLKHNFKIFAVAAILKTDLMRKYGCFDPQLYYLNDWYLLNEMAFKHPLALITELLSRFRIHDSNFSNIYRHNKKTKMATYRRLFEKLNLKENKFYKEQVRKSALLSFVFQDLFWKLLFQPKYLTYWPYINQKYPIKHRLKASLKKKFTRCAHFSLRNKPERENSSK